MGSYLFLKMYTHPDLYPHFFAHAYMNRHHLGVYVYGRDCFSLVFDERAAAYKYII